VEEIQLDAGNVTNARLAVMLGNQTAQLKETLESSILKVGLVSGAGGQHSINMADGTGRLLFSERKFDVPHDFKFPSKCNLRMAWMFWLKGMALGNNKFIMPFRFLEHLPSKLRRKYRNEWKPILEIMEEGVLKENEGAIPTKVNLITDAILQSTFTIGENYLQSRTSFLFSDLSQKGVRQRAAWTIGTWSKKVKPSSVEKFGTDSDKDLLMQETERRGRGTQRYRTYFQRNRSSLSQNIVQDSGVSARITADL